MAENNPHGVAEGQIWADNDKRSAGRMVKVLSVGDTHAWVVACDPAGRWSPSPLRARHTRIKLTRFRPTATGYQLVTVADAGGGR